MKTNAGRFACLGEFGAFGQEAIAGMDGVHPRLPRRMR